MPDATSIAGSPRANGLFVRLRVTGAAATAAARADLAARARGAVQEVLGAGWTTTPFWQAAPREPDFRAVPPEPITAAQLWDAVYDLRAHREIERTEPLLQLMVVPPETSTAAVGGELLARLSCTDGDDLPAAAADCEWSLKMVRAQGAWRDLGSAGLGRGVMVGHPGTGYSRHPELEGRVAPGGYDFLTETDDPADPLQPGGAFSTPGHATACASVIAASRGPDGMPHVTGVAPDATVMDLRVTDSVLVFDMGHVARAIRYAADRGCRVISLGFGGMGWGYLHDAVKYAVGRGCIVLAAAGNCVGFVVWPATYDETVAVAACNVREQPWSGSSSGSAVDVAAPGDSVWRAIANPMREPRVAPGKGTCLAVGSVAGAAALWLGRHGWQALADRYGQAAIAPLFKQLLVEKGVRTPAGWDARRYGAGILDAQALLRAELPAAAPRSLPDVKSLPVSSDLGGLSTVAHMVEHLGAPESAIRWTLARSLGISPGALDAYLSQLGPELTVHLGTDPFVRDSFEAEVRTVAARGVTPLDETAASGGLTATGRALRRVGSRKLRRAMSRN